MDHIIFTDDWWNWFLHTYSFMIALLWAVLKALAILDPSNKSNQVLDTFRGMLSRSPDKDLARREEDKKE